MAWPPERRFCTSRGPISNSVSVDQRSRPLATARGRVLRARESLGSSVPDCLHEVALEVRMLRKEVASIGRPAIAPLAEAIENAAHREYRSGPCRFDRR